MVILGVDPGSRRTGYGVIERCGGELLRVCAVGVIAPPLRADLPERIWMIHQAIAAIVEEHRPEVMAVEDVFHAANARTAIVLGHVRGAILVAAARFGVAICAYPPARVKSALTGYGQADKRQVAHMVGIHLHLDASTRPADATDALAVAICHAHHAGSATLLSGATP
jgi:crossover junction endodeoxyribonuclease RuvC